MPVILENPMFTVVAPEKPHHSRENGGHIVVWTTNHEYEHLSDMPLDVVTQFIQLNQVVGEAFMKVARKNGLEPVRINYACFGNWNYKEPIKPPATHMNVYLRVWGEKHPDDNPRFQAFPEALYLPDRKTGYYDRFEPLTDPDCVDIKAEMHRLLQTEKYNQLTIKV